jgi:hypothetical protein
MTVLASSVRGEYNTDESQALHELFRQVVRPILTMQDPLSVASLASLLRADIASLRRTLGILHLIFDMPETDSNAVQLLYPSFCDFFLDPS